MDHLASAEDSTPWKDCLDFARQLLSKNMDFCFTVKVGSTLSFSLNAQKARKHLQSDGVLGSKVKQKSPSTKTRDRIRQEQFFAKKKAAAAVSTTTSLEPACGDHSLEAPRGSPIQRTPDETSQTSLETNLPRTRTSKADNEGQRLAQKTKIMMDIKESTKSTKECLDKMKALPIAIELIQQEGQKLAKRLKTWNENNSP